MPDFLNMPMVTLVFILLDVVSGIAQALANKDLSSEKLRKGLFHKMAFIFSVALGYLIEFTMAFADLGFSFPVASAVCIYVCLTEITSIIENITLLNPSLKDSRFLDIFRASGSNGQK